LKTITISSIKYNIEAFINKNKQKELFPMKINNGIIEAIKLLIEDCGNAYQLSKKIGVSHSTVLFWLDGKTSRISGDVWHEKLYPLLRPYLKYSETFTGAARGGEERVKYRPEVVPAKRLNEAPVLNFAQAAGYDPAFEPIDDYALNCACETALFDCEVNPGYFALRVDGESMSPVLPDGAIVYVAGGEYAQPGDLVVAKIRDSGQVVIKKFLRSEESIFLKSINPDGQNFEWGVKENPLVWIWPVIEYTVKARKQRWEKCKRKQGFV
jgi:SOS-response transcriptional repressor LexA